MSKVSLVCDHYILRIASVVGQRGQALPEAILVMSKAMRKKSTAKPIAPSSSPFQDISIVAFECRLERRFD